MDLQVVGIWTVARSSADSSVDVPMKSNERQAQESFSSQLIRELCAPHTAVVDQEREFVCVCVCVSERERERGREGEREREREREREYLCFISDIDLTE